MLQSNCINNGVINGIRQKKEKKHANSFIKERTGELLIGANTQNVPYRSIVATQHNTRQRRVRRLLIRIKARRYAGL